MWYVRVTFVQSTFFLGKFVHTSNISSVADLGFTTFLEARIFSTKLLCQFQLQFQLKQRLRLGLFSNKFFYQPTQAITQPPFQTRGERRLKPQLNFNSTQANSELGTTPLKLVILLLKCFLSVLLCFLVIYL